MEWVRGRQGGDYFKKLKFMFDNKIFGTDCYLLKFKPNCYLKPHKDKVGGGRHFRLNIELKGKGDFRCESTIFKMGRIVLFRPDKYIHSMKNSDTERVVLSIGLNLK